MRKEVIGNATLYLGDCLTIIPSIDRMDVVITDPPYGVGLGEQKYNWKPERGEYTLFSDWPPYIRDCVIPALEAAMVKSPRAVVTPGVKNFGMYPTPEHIGAIYHPAGTGCNPWGFTCWQPILYYGKDPWHYNGQPGTGSKPDSVTCTEASEKNGHPCPKPVNLMRWLVNRASRQEEIVFDPFMGSGTTGVAAVQLGRKFVGIEIEPKYFDIACERIENAQRQERLFA